MEKLEKEVYLGNTKNKFVSSEGISVIETDYQEKVSEDWHSHQNAHITLFLKGGTVEKRKNATHAVHSGSVLFYNSDEQHLNQNTQLPSKNINVEFDENFIKKNNLSENQLQICSANTQKTKLLILKIYKESLIGDCFFNDSVAMLFADYAADMNFAQQFCKNPRWVGALFELLNDCWDENIALKELSKILGVNPVSISKYFPKYFGCTYGEYMRRLKVSKSIELIQQNSASLTEIALQCGFADQSHFIRTFKAQTNFLPKDFRKL